jgi:FtsP/CotA-like multicopper oxidase with cupredoxin domain
VIEVVNDLVDEGVAIHWHGLWMRGKSVKKLVGLRCQNGKYLTLRPDSNKICTDVQPRRK